MLYCGHFIYAISLGTEF